MKYYIMFSVICMTCDQRKAHILIHRKLLDVLHIFLSFMTLCMYQYTDQHSINLINSRVGVHKVHSHIILQNDRK